MNDEKKQDPPETFRMYPEVQVAFDRFVKEYNQGNGKDTFNKGYFFNCCIGEGLGVSQMRIDEYRRNK